MWDESIELIWVTAEFWFFLTFTRQGSQVWICPWELAAHINLLYDALLRMGKGHLCILWKPPLLFPLGKNANGIFPAWIPWQNQSHDSHFLWSIWRLLLLVESKPALDCSKSQDPWVITVWLPKCRAFSAPFREPPKQWRVSAMCLGWLVYERRVGWSNFENGKQSATALKLYNLIMPCDLQCLELQFLFYLRKRNLKNILKQVRYLFGQLFYKIGIPTIFVCNFSKYLFLKLLIILALTTLSFWY